MCYLICYLAMLRLHLSFPPSSFSSSLITSVLSITCHLFSLMLPCLQCYLSQHVTGHYMLPFPTCYLAIMLPFPTSYLSFSVIFPPCYLSLYVTFPYMLPLYVSFPFMFPSQYMLPFPKCSLSPPVPIYVTFPQCYLLPTWPPYVTFSLCFPRITCYLSLLVPNI